MKSISNHEEDQFPASELNKKEKQLLQAYQDREYLNRWEKVTASSDRKERRTSSLKWIVALAVLASALFFLFGENWFKTVPPAKPAEIAGLVDYPFMEQQVRGTAASSNDERIWKESISRYKKGAYAEALEKSKALNRPFFKGMCLLQLNRYEESIQQFDLALQMPEHSSEINYYKGFGLQQLGRKEEAKAQFKQALESRELREAWRNSAKKMIEE
ncbi:MAG: hypothetical protein H7246_04965 [Phycisphaerae bacterium]|nr:hypothetical protein [Saprospiraceae bacterium]